MPDTKYLIIGAGPASSWAIRGIRQEDPDGKIMLIGKEPYRTYSLPLLTKGFIQGRYPEDKIYLVKEDFYEKAGVEFISGKTVLSVNSEDMKVTLDDRSKIGYEKLLIATGGSPLKFPFSEGELPNVYYLRTLDDAKAIRAAAEKAKKAVVIGGGFIGVELASAFRELGLEVDLLMLEDNVWEFLLAEEVSGYIMDIMRDKGVNIYPEQTVSGFEESSGLASSVSTTDGNSYEADMFCVGIGIRLNIDFIRGTELELGRGVIVNEYLESSIYNIFAAGDVAEYHDLALGTIHVTGHIENAQFQGRTAGQNMAGGRVQYNRITAYDTEVFGHMLMFIGAPHMGTSHVARVGTDGPIASFALKYDKLVGGVLINPSGKDVKALRELITMIEVDFKKLEDKLKDPDVELSSLLEELSK